MSLQRETDFRPVAVIDLGASDAQVVARRIRALEVLSELVSPGTSPVELETSTAQAVVVVGSGERPARAIPFNKALWQTELPVLVWGSAAEAALQDHLDAGGAAPANLVRATDGSQEGAGEEAQLEELRKFLFERAGIEPDWTPENIVAEQVERIRARVGDARVISALSGGVDSAVSTA